MLSIQTIKTVQNEIRKIRKHLSYRVFDFVKAKPVIALVISSVFAITLGIAGSLIASFIYDCIKTVPPADISSKSSRPEKSSANGTGTIE